MLPGCEVGRGVGSGALTGAVPAVPAPRAAAVSDKGLSEADVNAAMMISQGKRADDACCASRSLKNITTQALNSPRLCCYSSVDDQSIWLLSTPKPQQLGC